MLAQGGSDLGGRLDDAGVLRTATGVARSLLATLVAYKDGAQLAYLLDTVDCELVTQLDDTSNRMIAYKELDEQHALEFKASFQQKRDEARKAVMEAVKAGITAVEKAEGTKKLQEALDGLDIRERFNVNFHPAELPANLNDLFAFFDVPIDKRTPALAIILTRQREAHVKEWRAPPPGVIFSNKAVFTYWADLATTARELSDFATLQWRRPISSASVERIYSILTHMDNPTRRSMGRTLLEQLLFLAGNARVVSGLLHEFAESTRHAAEAVTEGRLKRRRGAEAAAAQRGAAAAAAALHARHDAAAAAAGGAAGAASDDDGEAMYQ